MVINTKNQSRSLKKKLKNLLVTDSLGYEDDGTVELKEGVLENTDHFINKLYECFPVCEAPEVSGSWDGKISFLWEPSLKPIKQIEIYVDKDKLTTVLEDEVDDLRVYKDFLFSPETKTFPKEVMGYLNHFMAQGETE